MYPRIGLKTNKLMADYGSLYGFPLDDCYYRFMLSLSKNWREPIAMTAGDTGTVRFGAFEVDPRTGDLRKLGVRIKIQDQPMRVLTFLLEQPGELITREELQQRLWPDVSHLDFEHGLNGREETADRAERFSRIAALYRDTGS